MKNNRNLYELLATKGVEINNEINKFVQTIDKKYEIYTGLMRLGESKSSGIRMKWDTETGLVNMFSIEVSGKHMKEFYEESNGFLGLGKREYKKVFKQSPFSKDLICYPFIPSMFSASTYNPKYPNLNDKIYTDLGEFIKIVETSNFIDFDTQTFDKIIAFVRRIINQCLEEISGINESLNIELSTFIKEKDGKIELIDSSDLMKLLQRNQSQVIEVDKDYLHKFVRLSNYLKQREKNIQSVFDAINNENSITDKKELIGILKNQIHNYELVLFHSLNMVVSLCSGNLIEFYEIYESFDKLNIFNSNWENEVSEKLSNIGDKLNELMYSIYSMEQKIVSELNQLSYITSESFNLINTTVSGQLKEIKSSIDTNVLFNGIQAYQLYKINKNTKSLRG